MPLNVPDEKGAGILDNESSVKAKEVDMFKPDDSSELLLHKPGVFIKWGNFIMLTILLLVLLASALIKYPYVVKGSAKLTSTNAPKPVTSIIPGQLTKLIVEENENVTKEDAIGFIEATGDHNDVLGLSALLDSLDNADPTRIKAVIDMFLMDNHRKLGELQPAYQAFVNAVISYRNFLPREFYDKKKQLLILEKNYLTKIQRIAEEQKFLQEREVLNTRKTFQANELLKKENVISDFDYRLEESKLISKELALPQINGTIINNEILLTGKHKELIDLENTISHQANIFKQEISTFRSQLNDWKRKYILSAPVDGRVKFASFVQENQELLANQTVCFINPENSEYFAQVNIPQSNFGKVKTGQQVLLKMESYPFEEYGFLEGTIELINHIPVQNGYEAKIALTNGVTTTTNQQIQFREGLVATAEIITVKMSLLERFYFKFVRKIDAK